jgi:hypothetical protein
MIKVLEEAIEKVKKLPADRQAYVAEILEQIVSDAEEGVFEIPDEHMERVLEGLEQAKRGEFASDEEVNEVLRKPWR